MSNVVNAYNGNEPYIFVSYSHKDSNIVVPAIEAMQQQDFRIWFDRGIEAGTEWSNNIAAHLRDCAVFVAFISKNSVKSENCLDEIAYAKSHGKPSLLIFLEEDVTLPEGTEMQTARFQRMFYNRQGSIQSFIDNICTATVLSTCRGAGTAESVPRKPIPEPAPAKPKNKNLLLIIAIAVALVIIIALVIALVSKDGDTIGESSIAESSQAEASAEESEASQPKAPIAMSDDLYDCTFKLEGEIYKLPCSLADFTSNGWAISSSGYSTDKLINGLSVDAFSISKNGKKINIGIANRSGNKARLEDCPVISVSATNGYGAEFEIAKGITLSSTLDEIINAFGTPYSRDESTHYETALFASDDEYSYAEFTVYDEDNSDETTIELACYRFEDTVTTETNTALPEYLSQYTTPDTLGNDLYSGNFKLEGDIYSIPAPVKAFLDNGWAISSAPKYVVAGGEDKIKISKNGATIEVSVINFGDYQTLPENCVVTNLPVYNYDNAKIELPAGITHGMTEAELDSRVPAEYDKLSSEYSVNYSYSAITPRDLYIYLYIDVEKGDALSYIRINSEEWEYGN